VNANAVVRADKRDLCPVLNEVKYRGDNDLTLGIAAVTHDIGPSGPAAGATEPTEQLGAKSHPSIPYRASLGCNDNGCSGTGEMIVAFREHGFYLFT